MKPQRLLPLAALLFSPVLLHASDPFVGSWSLDPAQSRYPRGLCPRQMTIDMTDTGHGIHYHSQTLTLTGNSFTADYTAAYDEKPVVVSGARGVLLPVALKQVTPNEVVASYISGLQVRATSRRVLSANATVMTITTTSQDGVGTTLTTISVYKKLPTPMPDLAKIHTTSLF